MLVDNNTQVVLTLPLMHVNTILKALGQLSLNESYNAFRTVEDQASAQIKAVEEADKAEEVKKETSDKPEKPLSEAPKVFDEQVVQAP